MMAEEYPQLREWLAKHNARCAWQRPGPSGTYIEHWRINGHVVIVVLYPKRNGWDLFTQVGGNTTIICETLAEAEAKLGLSGSPHGTPLIYVVTSEVLAYAKRHDGKVITDRPKLSEHDTWHVAAFTPEEATRLVRERIPQTYQWREPEVKAISVNATIETVRRLPR